MTESNRSNNAGAPGIQSAQAWPQAAGDYSVSQPPHSPVRRRSEGGGEEGSSTGGNGPSRMVTVDHVADYAKRYPGEVVTFHTRVSVAEEVPGFTLRVELPPGVELDTYRADDPMHLPQVRTVATQPQREAVMLPGADGGPFPIMRPDRPMQLVEPSSPAQVLVWEVAEPLEPGRRYNFEAAVLVLPVLKEMVLRSQAAVYVDLPVAPNGDSAPETGSQESQVESQRVSAETAQVQVQPKGRYLSHLPALFEQDDFMSRFLMLFESFWRPIEQQIDSVEHYFDPDLTPSRFLPWLASWFDLTLDESLDDDQRRELLGAVMWLYRRRGTRIALQRYLEIYTRASVQILERRAKNFVLGASARMGVGVALGRANQPHTFTVRIRLAPLTLPPDVASELSDEEAEQEIARREQKRLALIHRLIAEEKPAHTSYRLEILPADSADAPDASGDTGGAGSPDPPNPSNAGGNGVTGNDLLENEASKNEDPERDVPADDMAGNDAAGDGEAVE